MSHLSFFFPPVGHQRLDHGGAGGGLHHRQHACAAQRLPSTQSPEDVIILHHSKKKKPFGVCLFFCFKMSWPLCQLRFIRTFGHMADRHDDLSSRRVEDRRSAQPSVTWLFICIIYTMHCFQDNKINLLDVLHINISSSAAFPSDRFLNGKWTLFMMCSKMEDTHFLLK